MMRIYGLLLLGAAFAAGAPLGYVRSSDAFRVSGIVMPAAGNRVWPVVSGDEITTLTAALTIRFRDGSRITLGRKSRAKVEAVEDRIKASLLDGAMEFRLSRAPKLDVYHGAVRQAGASGAIGSPKPDTGGIHTQALPPVSRWR